MNIYSLLKAGELDGLSVGVAQARAIAALKRLTPNGKVSKKDINGVVVVRNDIVEVHVVDQRVNNIILDMAGSRGKTQLTIASEKRKLNRQSSLEQTVALLSGAGVAWKFFQKYCGENRVELITEGSASIEFLAESGKITINRIHLTDGDVYY